MPIIDFPTRRASLTSWISSYRDVLATPGLRGVVVTSAIARLPKGMAPLSLVVLVRDTGHSYVIAGLVAALLGLGDSVTTPRPGPAADSVPARHRRVVIDSWAHHPLRALLDAGVLVTLNAGDPAMFGTSLVNEYATAASVLGLSRDELVTIARHGVDATFMSAQRKRSTHAEIDRHVEQDMADR